MLANGDIEVQKDEGVDVAITAGPTEFPPVIEAGKEVLPTVRIAGWVKQYADSIINKMLEEEKGGLVLREEALDFKEANV
jgi:hypothetical protein